MGRLAALAALLLAGCATGSGTPTPSPAPSATPPGPDFVTDFASQAGQWETVIRGGGRIDFGLADPAAVDAQVVELRFPGDARLRPGDRVGPGYATEIDSRRDFLYGTFRARLRLATCRSNEEAVNGFFTYFNDGSDANGNGLPDNSEIDIEILCGTPSFVSLSSWTDYRGDPERFIKKTRVVDLTTGDLFESPSDHEYGLVKVGNDASLRHPDFPDPRTFYEMGFEWQASRLRFFMVLGGAELTLWEMTESRYVPQRPSAWLFNVWHPAEHWFPPEGPGDYPAADAALRLDWARHWAE